MELIKRIKEAESSGCEIIEKARADSAKMIADGKEKHAAMLDQAQENRRVAIAQAESDAEAQGQSQVETLRAEDTGRREKLTSHAKGKMAECVGKVVSQLKGV